MFTPGLPFLVSLCEGFENVQAQAVDIEVFWIKDILIEISVSYSYSHSLEERSSRYKRMGQDWLEINPDFSISIFEGPEVRFAEVL